MEITKELWDYFAAHSVGCTFLNGWVRIPLNKKEAQTKPQGGGLDFFWRRLRDSLLNFSNHFRKGGCYDLRNSSVIA